jgi:hypothetical protein
MEALRIDPTDDCPFVIFDPDNGKFEISGKSLPEDVVTFYQPLLDWMEVYKASPLDKTVFDFKLIYFNTASSKMILDILLVLEEMKEEGKDILIKWHSQSNDEDMQEAGEEYADMVEIEFEYLTYDV